VSLPEDTAGHLEPVPPGLAPAPAQVSLATVLREWGRIGCIGFGGPPTHIKLLRELCVERRKWLDGREFEDAIAACNLLPGPASTQLAIFCAWRVRGRFGALVGGSAFIVPGLIVILALSALFLAGSPPLWVLGAGAGAGAAVPAVAVQAGWSLLGASWRGRAHTARWVAYLLAGAAAAATTGEWLPLILLGCGAIELTAGRPRRHPAAGQDAGPRGIIALPVLAAGAITGGVLASVAWVAFKVGALSYGGGFVIIPLMQSDAVNHYHWMTAAQFLNAVALGQITPGPVVQTVAVVGYAAAGLAGGILASLVAFTPSFSFVLLGARRFDRLRGDRRARAFLGGAGPAAIGAILGSAIPLTRALTQPWQYAVLGAALILMIATRRGVVLTLIAAGVAGTLITLVGGPLPH
jgi:chromate transporter